MKCFVEKCKSFNFQKIVFSDKSSFKLLNTRGAQTYYKKAAFQTGNKNFNRTKKFGGGSVIFGTSLLEMENLKFVLLKDQWIQRIILKFLLIFSLMKLQIVIFLKNLFFQKDNASCYAPKNKNMVFRTENFNLWLASIVSWLKPHWKCSGLAWQSYKKTSKLIFYPSRFKTNFGQRSRKGPKTYISKLNKYMPGRISNLKSCNITSLNTINLNFKYFYFKLMQWW